MVSVNIKEVFGIEGKDFKVMHFGYKPHYGVNKPLSFITNKPVCEFTHASKIPESLQFDGYKYSYWFACLGMDSACLHSNKNVTDIIPFGYGCD